MCLHVGDNFFILLSCENTTKTANLVLNYLISFGLKMQIDSDKNKSTTEVLHTSPKLSISATIDISHINLSDGLWSTFNLCFTYLYTIFNTSLSNNEDINTRISKTNQTYRALWSLIFGNPHLSLKIKYMYILQSQ